MEPWALFRKVDGAWQYLGLTYHEEGVSEFLDMAGTGETRKAFSLEDGETAVGDDDLDDFDDDEDLDYLDDVLEPGEG